MQDLSPSQPSTQPPVWRDLSIAVSAEMDGELLGDAVRLSDAPEIRCIEVYPPSSSIAWALASERSQ
jgi:hypothetical protein